MQFPPLIIVVMTAAVVGCRKQITTPAAAPAIQPALAAWQRGDRAGAVGSFLTTDWSAGPIFAPNSVLSLTEAQFQAGARPITLPGTVLTGGTEAVRVQMTKEIDTVKHLAAAVAQAGRDAAATNDVALARKHFASLQRFAAALDTTNSLAILRLVAQGISKKAAIESATLPQ